MNFQPLDDPLMNGKKDPEPVSAVPLITPEKPVPAALAPKEKVKKLRDQLMFDPNNIDLRLQYIEAYLVEGKEAGLVDDYLDLAHIYRNSGQLDLARQYYAKVIAIDPSINEAKIRLEALEKTAQEPTNEPVDSPQPKSLGRELKSDPRPELPQELELSPEEVDKITQLKRILLINPINDDATKKVVTIYQSKNRFIEAAKVLVIAGDAYMNRGYFEKALNLYDQAIKLNPAKEISAKLQRALTYNKSNDAISQAIKSYKTGGINSLKPANR